MYEAANLRKRRFMICFTIGDGEYEYGEEMLKESDGTDEMEQAYQELADLYSSDDEEHSRIYDNLKTHDFSMIGERAIKDVFIRELTTVRVCTRGGVVQDIQNIPPEIKIQVQDYDIDGQTELDTDSEGNPCTISIWH